MNYVIRRDYAYYQGMAFCEKCLKNTIVVIKIVLQWHNILILMNVMNADYNVKILVLFFYFLYKSGNYR